MNLETIPMECSRWDRCSVNNCPLDPRYPNLVVHPQDKEQKCPMAKAIRVRIAEKFPGVLKYAGRTLREHNGFVQYERLAPAVKAERAQKGRERMQRLNSEIRGKTNETQ